MEKPKWPERLPVSAEELAAERVHAVRFYLPVIGEITIFTCDESRLRCLQHRWRLPRFEVNQ